MTTAMMVPEEATKPLTCYKCETWSELFATIVTPRVMDPAKDESVFACPECLQTLSKDAGERLQEWDVFSCGHCGSELSLENEECSGLLVLPESAPLMNTAEVKHRSWFHATHVPNWLDTVIDAGIYVHVGSHEAALERAAIQYFKRGLHGNEKKYLWEVVIKPEAVVSDDVVRDDNDWASKITACTKKHLGGDAQRYLNKFESAGSISLLIDPSQIESIEMVEILEEDCEMFLPAASA